MDVGAGYNSLMGIVLKSERELAKMREAGLIVRAVLDAVEAAYVPASA